jgi:hypothetical protein
MLVDKVKTVGQLMDKFKLYGRYEQFSVEAYECLFNYYDSLEETVELDVIDICCSYTEISFDDVIAHYTNDPTKYEDYSEMLKDAIYKYVEDYYGGKVNTVTLDNSILIAH